MLALAQQRRRGRCLEARVALGRAGPGPCRPRRRPARGRAPGAARRPACPATQCSGHGPPCAANEPWSGGCQSRVATTRSYSPEPASSSIRPAIASPSGTASAPPGVKSFWKSTMTSARATSESKHGADPAVHHEVVVVAHDQHLGRLRDRLLDRCRRLRRSKRRRARRQLEHAVRVRPLTSQQQDLHALLERLHHRAGRPRRGRRGRCPAASGRAPRARARATRRSTTVRGGGLHFVGRGVLDVDASRPASRSRRYGCSLPSTSSTSSSGAPTTRWSKRLLEAREQRVERVAEVVELLLLDPSAGSAPATSRPGRAGRACRPRRARSPRGRRRRRRTSARCGLTSTRTTPRIGVRVSGATGAALPPSRATRPAGEGDDLQQVGRAARVHREARVPFWAMSPRQRLAHALDVRPEGLRSSWSSPSALSRVGPPPSAPR